jgi:hypothetical protein
VNANGTISHSIQNIKAPRGFYFALSELLGMVCFQLYLALAGWAKVLRAFNPFLRLILYHLLKTAPLRLGGRHFDPDNYAGRSV